MTTSGSKNHLIIMRKNAELGKVKTRLAKDVGAQKALEIYNELLQYTEQVARPVGAIKKCYYSDYIENNDLFNDKEYEKLLQKGADLGARMYNAFTNSFGEWAANVVIIGADCFEINSGLIEEAFRALEKHDVVFGPAKDGGYYLVGMKKPIKELFIDKEWSHENVLLDAMIEVKNLKLTHYLLPTLSDVDYVSDLPQEIKERLL